jgi:lysophospholipase L1-like esterase/tetratricopeptide (TPR) repeat protein
LRPKKLLRASLFLVVLLAFVELVLQAAAFVVWSRQRAGETRSAGDGPVVLCVGDSMTYGLGATAGGSYPSQLEKVLRARDRRQWVTVNGGWPGRDSRQVLGLLPDQLARYAPDYVCVLVGTNDWWSQPGEAAAPEAAARAGAFPLVWRTRRLVEILVAGRRGEHGEEGFVGTWNRDGVELQFQPTGRLVLADDELRWSTRTGTLVVVMPNDTEIPVAWRVERGKLHLRSSLWPDEQVFAPGPAPAPTPLSRGRRALRAGDQEGAVAAFESALAAGGEDAVAAHEALAVLWAAKGDVGRAREQIAALEREHAAAPDKRALAESLARALAAVGEVERAIDLAARIVEVHPESDAGWSILLAHGTGEGRRAQTLAAIARATAALPTGHERRGQLLVQRALLVKEADTVQFLSCLFEALREGLPDKHVVNHVRLARAALDEATFERAAAAVAATPAERTHWGEVFARGLAGGDAVSSAMASHIREIVLLCQRAKAQPLLLDYPFRDLDHERLIDAVAAETDARRVTVRPRFDELLTAKPRDTLFIRDDIHCNDAGYAVMAEACADALLR